MSRRIALLLPALVGALLAAPLAAAPRIEIKGDAAGIEIEVVDAAPAAVMALLAATIGFTLDGAEALPTTPITAHLKGSLDRVIGQLTEPASRVATYADGNSARLVRLVLLPSGQVVRSLPAEMPRESDALAADDPAVGGSRMGADALREQIRTRLGLSLR
jgi:hypothetical protein